MGMEGFTLRRITEESAGDISYATKVVMQFLPETVAGKKFLAKYALKDGQIDIDRGIRCGDIDVLLGELGAENEWKFVKIIEFIRRNVSFIMQFSNSLKRREEAFRDHLEERKECSPADRLKKCRERAFKDYADYYKRLREANFFADKYFFSRWFDNCSNYEQRRDVARNSVHDKVPLSVERFKALVYDCGNDGIADEVAPLFDGMVYPPDDNFFLFCLRDSRDEVSRVDAVVRVYERVMGKSRSEFFKAAFLRCESNIDFDWIFSIMRMTGFKLTDQFFVECMEGANGMGNRAVTYSVYLRRIGLRPPEKFFDAWMANASSGMERKLVEKYSAGRR